MSTMSGQQSPGQALPTQETIGYYIDRTAQQEPFTDSQHEKTFEGIPAEKTQSQETPIIQQAHSQDTSVPKTQFEVDPSENIHSHCGGSSLAEDTHPQGQECPIQQGLHPQGSVTVQGIHSQGSPIQQTCHKGTPPVQSTLLQGVTSYHGLDQYRYDCVESFDLDPTANTDIVYQQESIDQTALPSENLPGQTVNPEEFRQREDARNKKAQEYFEFKENIGRLSTSCGDSFAGDMVAMCRREFAESDDNYLRGCKWSPDGRVLITNSNDNVMRTFHLPDDVIRNQWDVKTELKSHMKLKETDTVFDFCWHPGTTLDSPDTCLFATTCRETPIHLFNALTGDLVCSYRAYDHVDEIVAAHSIGFTIDGKYLVSGFNRTLRSFVTSRPGRDCTVTSTIVKERSRKGRVLGVQGQRSILSCFAAHPTSPSLVAAGAFNGDVAIYDIPNGAMTTMFEGQSGGITHVLFSNDGNYLFAGGRKNPEINCFDIRNPEKVLYVLYRYVATNQRIYFDLDRDSRYLLSGNHNGVVSVWDLQGEAQLYSSPHTPWPQLNPIINFQAHWDAVNGCSVNPQHSLLATCSGQRHFAIDLLDEVVDLEGPENTIPPQLEVEENALKIWNLKLPQQNEGHTL